MLNRFLWQTRRFTHYFDKLGNKIYDVKNNSLIDIHNEVEGTEKGKAILLKNVAGDVINKYNYNLRLHTKNEMDYKMKFAKYQCSIENSGVYLIKNWSNCSELCYGSIVSAKVYVLVKYREEYYTFLIKEKKKNYLTCPGGSATFSDIEQNVNTAVRHLLDKTSTIKLRGLDLSKSKLDLVYESKGKGKFFDIPNICETLKVYCFRGTICNSNIRHYLLRMFSNENLCEDGSYKMTYEDHVETDFVYALNLSKNKAPNEKILEHDITRLHVAISTANILKDGDQKII